MKIRSGVKRKLISSEVSSYICKLVEFFCRKIDGRLSIKFNAIFSEKFLVCIDVTEKTKLTYAIKYF